MNDYKIAIINPFRPDGLARTIFDGLLALNQTGSTINFKLSSKFDYILPLNDHLLTRKEFVEFARSADLIFVIWGKDGTDTVLAEEINCWHKTIYIDGSEVGKNRRYDYTIQKEILDEVYSGQGGVEKEMIKKSAGYFRREKPYLEDIKPLPFGIETRYVENYQLETLKDIDFVCIFGQDEYPLLRRHARELVEKYCSENNFVCVTKKTNTPEEFYKLLARSRVGVSVGGGGFDTYRFWEILGNNCLLLTEKIDIFEPESEVLNFKRIYQFSNLFDLQVQLEKVGQYLRTEYSQENLTDEYNTILKRHSSIARVGEIIEFAKDHKII